ncbi:MAG: hypothetical protein KJN80_09685, partial [Deltaproteobacteria bacterium]|nr:hypothetical protein [Deltaproteobacteria bacterium]
RQRNMGDNERHRNSGKIGAKLSKKQASNLKRFEKKLPKKAKKTMIKKADDGSVTFSSEVPGEVPPMFLRYLCKLLKSLVCA